MGTEIANTILKQLGGNRFITMTGSKNFIAGSNYLTFKLTPNKAKATHMSITLMPNDLYKIEAIKITNSKIHQMKRTVLTERTMVYADHLQSTFKDITGLDTHL